jgi:WD40 repeat protein
MIPDYRLAVLLQQVKQSQISNCTYHHTEASPSLYADHLCDRNNFPLRVIHELDKQSGEVWYIEFSHDGSRLAACGKEKSVLIYDVTSWEILHALEGHESSICSLSWSPDDSMIITCSMDKKARLFNSDVCFLPSIIASQT